MDSAHDPPEPQRVLSDMDTAHDPAEPQRVLVKIFPFSQTPGGTYTIAVYYRPDPPMSINPTEIYHKHVGMVPNYAGHVPGAMFRFGNTYGNDTRDAKRWLRGDFTS